MEDGMTLLEATKAKDSFSDTLNRTAYAKERIVLTRHGKPLAALVPLEDLELLEQWEDEADVEAARAAMAEAKEQGTISWEEFKASLGR
jgi:prevent-host-death family protein